MPFVSLIVPVYKAEAWIEECMASIRAQTYKEIELIVIDDSQGSGPAAARNRGLGKATGEFISFCDADDYLEPDAIQKLVAASNGVDMVAGSFRKFGDFEMTVTHSDVKLSLEALAEYVMENLKNPRSHQMLSGCWAKLYRRSLVRRFQNLTTAEDMVFNFEYLKRCKAVRFISDIVYHNRKHMGSLTTTFDERNKLGLFGFMEGLKHVKRFLAKFYVGFPQPIAITRRRIRIYNAINNSISYHSMLYFMRICAQTGLPMNEVFKRLYP